MKLEQIGAYYLFGGGSENPHERYMGYGIPDPTRDGWRTFINHHVHRDVDLGIRKFHLHNPFGLSSLKATMPFNQYRECEHSPRKMMRSIAYNSAFSDVWRQAIDDLGIEVTAYIGCLRADKLFDTLTVNEAIEYFQTCTGAFVRAGMDIAIDAVKNIGVDDVRYSLMRWLEMMLACNGRRLFQEPRPDIGMPHLLRFPVVATAAAAHRTDPLFHPKDAAERYARTDQLAALRLILTPKPGQEIAALQQAWGWYPGAEVFYTPRLHTLGKPIKELLASNGMGGDVM